MDATTWTECFMGVRRVAVCLPFQINGQYIELYWYGILASIGIFAGAWYAAKYVEWQDENPDIVWDALLWVLIPALVGARLWYVTQILLSTPNNVYISEPLQILNFRAGGMNIFGGIAFGLIAVIVYARVKKIDGWLLADSSLLGALIGQGIGRFGNFINQELYGPPTTLPWGVKIEEEFRLGQWRNMETYPYDSTFFHPTFFYEALWLFVSVAVLHYIHRRFKDRMVRGVMTGAYLIASGIGRFWIEYFRPDQPLIPLGPTSLIQLSFSRFLSIVYVLVGLILVLDRYDYVRIPFMKRPGGPIKQKGMAKTPSKNRKRRKRAKPHRAK